MSTPVTTDRPSPIDQAVKSVGTGVSAILAVVTFLVQYGVFTPDQQQAINDAGQVVISQANPLAAVVSAICVAIAGVVASFAAGKTAKTKVTPVADPRDNDGRPLTPAGQ